MVRPLMLVAVLVSALSLATSGCRSCSSCHDYDRPVSDCECGCGSGRAGSAFTGGCNGGCESGNCDSGNCGPAGCQSCGSGGTYSQEAPPMEGEYAEYE